MNVEKLIEELQKCDPAKMVVRGGYEGGMTEVNYVSDILLKLDVNTAWYYGEHEEIDTDEEDHEDGVEAISIG